MRTFHIGGVAQGGQRSSSKRAGGIIAENANTLKNASETLIGPQYEAASWMKREERAIGLRFKTLCDRKGKVARGDKLLNGIRMPIIAEKSATVKYVDLVSGIAVRDETDDATGMTQKIVTDWRAAPKGNELKPEIILIDDSGEPVRGENGNPITYPMSVDAILSVEDGQSIIAGDVVARIPREGAKTKDITGGLPRVAELFEARRPKDHAIIMVMVMFALGETIRTSAASVLSLRTKAGAS